MNSQQAAAHAVTVSAGGPVGPQTLYMTASQPASAVAAAAAAAAYLSAGQHQVSAFATRLDTWP